LTIATSYTKIKENRLKTIFYQTTKPQKIVSAAMFFAEKERANEKVSNGIFTLRA